MAAGAESSTPQLINVSGFEAKLRRLSRNIAPAPSLKALLDRCPPPRTSRANLTGHLVILRVPKAGSTSFAYSLSRACNHARGSRPRLKILQQHELAKTDGCANPTVALVRDPCERLVSMYRHMDIHVLHELHHRTHWVRAAKDADQFVSLLRTRWPQVMASRVLPFVDGWSTREGARPQPSWEAFWRASLRHDVTLMPQVLWLSNSTYAICMHDFQAAALELMRAMQCSPVGVDAPADAARYQHETLLRHLHLNALHGLSATRATSGYAPAATVNRSKFDLSASGCVATRELYAEDAALWDRLCGKTAERDGGARMYEGAKTTNHMV